MVRTSVKTRLPTGSEIVEVFRSLVKAEQFVDVLDRFVINSKLGVQFFRVWRKGECWQQIEVSSTVHRVFAVESFSHL